jgi:fibronectin-binding autotransporter adhesin
MMFVRSRCFVFALIFLALASIANAQTDYFWQAPVGSTGSWDNVNFNWSDALNGPQNYQWQSTGNERANFGGGTGATAGTVTLTAPITAYGLNFATANYVIAGGANPGGGVFGLTLSGTGGVINSNVAASITAPIAGNVGLTKTGSGALTLNAANTYSGTTTVTGGTLVGDVQVSGSPFSSGPITLNGAILNLKSLTANTTTTSVGNLTISGTSPTVVGTSNFVVDNTGGGGSNTTAFSAGNLVRGGLGSVLVITPQTGALGSNEQVKFSNGNSLLTNGILPPWVISTATGSNTAGDFVTYGANGVAAASYSGDLSISNNTSVVNQTSSPTITGAASAYALKTSAAINLNNNSLTLGNGSGQSGLILNSGGSITNGNISFGNTEGLIYSQGTTSLGSIGNTLTSNGLDITGLGVTTLTLNNNINDGSQSAALNLTAITSGSNIMINGTNAYTGGTTLSYQGSLSVGNNSAFGTGKVTNIIVPGTGSPGFAASGGDRVLANAFDLNGGLNFTGTNSLQFNGAITIINAAATSRTLQNQITTAGKSVTLGASPGSSTITLGNPVANGGDGVGKTLVVSSNATSTTIINDVVQDPAAGGGTASGGVQYSGAAATGIVRINSLNTYSGTTNLAGTSTIQIGSDSVGSYPNITSGPFGTGLLDPTGGTNNALQPVGGSRTIANVVQLDRGFIVSNATSDPSAGLTFSGPINMTANGRTITNSFTAGTGGTLTLGSAGSPSVITGATVTGQTLTIADTGNTVINDSIQEVPNSGNATAISISGGGNLTLNGVISTGGLITVGSTGGTNAVPNPVISFNAMNTFGGGMTFTGPGTLVPVVNSSNSLPGAGFTSGPFGTGQININNQTNQHFRPRGGDRSISNPILLTFGIAMDNDATGSDSARNLTLAGPITYGNNGRFISNGFVAGTSGGSFIIGDPSAPSTITMATGTNQTVSFAALAGPIVVNDVIQDASGFSGNVTINPNNSNNNPVTFNNANTYSGTTALGNGANTGSGAVQLGTSTVGDFGGGISSGPLGVGTITTSSTTATPPALVPFNADRTLANAINLNGNLAAANSGAQTFNLNLTGPVLVGATGRSIINNMAGTLTLGKATTADSPNAITLSQTAGQALTFNGASTSTTVVNDAIVNENNNIIPGNVTVAGSIVNLQNNNSYSGDTILSGGKLLANNTNVGSGGSATGSGAVTVSGGILGGNGTIAGQVTVNSGAIAPGNSAGKLTLDSGVTFASGSAGFNVEIGGTSAGTTYDQLVVGGAADLTAGGALNVSLINGFSDPTTATDFTILTAAGGVTGTFTNLSFPDANWTVTYLPNSIVLHAAAAPAGVAGDYNHNGVVDMADYVLWRNSKGQTGAGLAADGNHDNVVDDNDYSFWRARFGNTSGSGSALGSGAAVPEPGVLSLLVCLAGAVLCSAGRTNRR